MQSRDCWEGGEGGGDGEGEEEEGEGKQKEISGEATRCRRGLETYAPSFSAGEKRTQERNDEKELVLSSAR